MCNSACGYLFLGATREVAPDAVVAVHNSKLTLVVRGPGSEGLSGPMLRYVDGFPSVVFHRNGSATSDAVAYLSASAGALEELRAVLLDQSSGRPETYRFADGRWEEDER